MSELSFLDGDDPVIAPEAAPEPQLEVIAADPEIPASPEPAPESTAPQPVMVPVSAVQQERERRQAAEARLAALEAAQSAPEMPDPEYDPAAYQQAIASQLQFQVQQDRLNMSEDFARQKHGEPLVDEAKQWALDQIKTRPGFHQEVLTSRNPYEFVVQSFRKDQIASKITDPAQFDQFLAWQQAQAAINPAPTAPSLTPVVIPPRSQVNAPSAGGVTHVPQGPGQAFDALFKGQ